MAWRCSLSRLWRQRMRQPCSNRWLPHAVLCAAPPALLVLVLLPWLVCTLATYTGRLRSPALRSLAQRPANHTAADDSLCNVIGGYVPPADSVSVNQIAQSSFSGQNTDAIRCKKKRHRICSKFRLISQEICGSLQWSRIVCFWLWLTNSKVDLP